MNWKNIIRNLFTNNDNKSDNDNDKQLDNPMKTNRFEKTKITNGNVKSFGIWNPTKTKTLIKISIESLRLSQSKLNHSNKLKTREIAEVLRYQKIPSAKIKVEVLINDEIYGELLELLELYCELLLARFNLLEYKFIDSGINEAVTSIIKAAPRTDLKEVHQLQELLMYKYGREFSLEVLNNPHEIGVNQRVLSKMDTSTPDEKLVNAYLSTIANAYDIPFDNETDEQTTPPPTPPPNQSEKELPSSPSNLKSNPPTENPGEQLPPPPIHKLSPSKSNKNNSKQIKDEFNTSNNNKNDRSDNNNESLEALQKRFEALKVPK